MEGFKKNPKIACFKEGGQVKYESRKEHKEEMAADTAQDKAMVKKGVAQHESKLHKGEPKTELKLKTGGRAKKEKGTVKKYCGGSSVKKMAEGGLTGQGSVSDTERSLVDKVLGTPEQNAASAKRLEKIAKEDSLIGKLERGAQKAANLLKGQGAVTDAERAAVAKKRGGKC